MTRLFGRELQKGMFDEEELTQSQLRLVRSLNIMIHNVLTTSDESELFNGSAEMMRICAALIKQAKFIEGAKKSSKIQYSEQAIEYALELLNEHLEGSKVIKYDN